MRDNSNGVVPFTLRYAKLLLKLPAYDRIASRPIEKAAATVRC